MIAGDIFIVDDNLTNLQLLENILTRNNYRVRMANSGKRALAAIQAALPELIMLDITMPQMDGYEVCKELKNNPTTSNIPVIFISALDDALDKVKAFRTGGADYVTKPFQAEEVLVRVENQLTISRIRKELEQKNKELKTKNEELIKKNEELIMSYKRADTIFSAMSELLPGTILDNKYQLESRLGSGGFGVVYKATSLVLNRLVAIKIFRPISGNSSPENLARFRFEGVSACRVNHPNAITIYDFAISPNGIAYLVMELLEGQTLAQELETKSRLSIHRCVEILFPICNVLSKAHESGIVHRDIKPDNIFLHQTENSEVVKVLDFGIAKLLGDNVALEMQNLTMSGNLVGTPAYLAPERIGDLAYDGKSDIYSLGIIFYRMLSGRLPFQTQNNEFIPVLVMHMEKEVPRFKEFNLEIPQPIEDLVINMLAKNPALRPTSKALADELTNIANNLLPAESFILEDDTLRFPKINTPNFIFDETTFKIDNKD